jgi:hypothetical protein
VTLVQSGTDGQKEYAAGALRNLANNAENKVVIAQAGAIAPLVTLVQSGTDGQKEYAAGALFSLAATAKNQVLIAQAGAVLDPSCVDELLCGAEKIVERSGRVRVLPAFERCAAWGPGLTQS